MLDKPRKTYTSWNNIKMDCRPGGSIGGYIHTSTMENYRKVTSITDGPTGNIKNKYSLNKKLQTAIGCEGRLIRWKPKRLGMLSLFPIEEFNKNLLTNSLIIRIL